jgi:hypothetical protein
VRSFVVLLLAAAAAGSAAQHAAGAAGPVDRTVSCATAGSGAFHVEYTPYAREGWFAVSIGFGKALLALGSGRGFEVDGTRCRPASARVALTRNGIRGRWLVYESQPFCAIPGRVLVHVRGRVHEDNRFTGYAAVRTSRGVRVAYATFDESGTAKAYVTNRCTA